MTGVDVDPRALAVEARTRMVPRIKALVDAGTTEMAPSVLQVPVGYYRDRDLFERERADVRRVPLALVPSCRVASPGDFVVRDLCDTSVLVTRDGEGTAHALLNYCRHRGARVAGGCGSARRHACPYHGWTYDPAGRLVGIPGPEGFDGLDLDAHGLVELPTEERHGFVWGALSADVALDVAGHLGPLDDELASWDLATYEFLTDRELRSEVSWKAALEAFAETYHFPYVHGQSLIGRNTVANTSTYDRFGLHHRLGFACPWIADVPAGEPHPSPLEVMVFVYWVYPNLVIAVSPVGAELIDILPGTHPGQCVLRHGWMAAVPAPDEATRAGYHELFAGVHAAVRDEDFGLLPTCGEGLRRGQHPHVVVGRNEIGVQHVVRTFAERFGIDLAG